MSSAARVIALYLAVHSLCFVDAQVLLNPSFDSVSNGLDSWSGVSATVIANTAEIGDGNFHVKLTGFPSSISQDITGLTVGTSYRVRFLVSANKANNLERMQVTVGTDKKLFRGVPNIFIEVDMYFTAARESENLKVENVNSNWKPDDSRSVLLDGFSVVAADPPPISPLDNPSFEVDEMGASNQDYLYMVPTGWVGSGGTVVARNTNSPWGTLSSGVGKYYAALQNKGASLGGLLYNLVDGQEYRVQFLSAGRPNSSPDKENQILKVSIDDIEIFRHAMPRTDFRMYTATFTASSTTHFIKFEQDAPEKGDKTVFLDAVSLYAGDPSTSALVNPSFEEDDLWEVFNNGGSTHQHYAYIQPAGWTRTGTSGTVVAYNKNSDWGLNPSWGSFDSKAGRNFAVLQRQGAALSQSVSGFLVGRTYKISFLAARRPGSLDSLAKLQVRVNGEVVKHGWTPPTAFTLYEIAFEVLSTTAEIEFKNVSPDDEDRSVFIDAVSIVRPAVCTTDHDYELQGSCWKVLPYREGIAYADAKLECEKWGGQLATIKKEIENERLFQRMLTNTGVTFVWLGGQRNTQGDAWNWPDSTDFSDYENWGDDEPDNHDHMVMISDGTWNARGNGDTIHAAACQKPATVCDVVSSGYCYAVHAELVSRADASALCMAWGGSLATIPDQTAEAKLGQFLSSSMPPAWVGASRSMPGAHWRWDDSAPITYLNFQTFEPENDESCAIADPANGAALLGSPCDSLVKSPYICSRRLMTPCSGQQTRSASSGLIGDMHSLPEQLCTWLIQPSVLAKSITLTFNRLDIEKGFDYVHVYDENGNKIASYTGSETLPEVEVQGPMIKVVFETDWAVQNENGFEAKYVAKTMTCSDYPCDNRSTCAQKQDGTFTCVCNDGYMGDGDLSYDGPGCSDINECTSNSVPYPCGQNARCNNTIGSATCTCEVGYEGYPYDDDSTNASCANILECEAATSPCDADATCTDTNGSFTCKCHTGFSGDGIYCDDINECTGGSRCDFNAECTNLNGTFKCECNDGWQGNGFPSECSDVNECAPGNVNTCEELHGVCHNEPGSYWCNCSAGWTTADNFDPAQPYGDGSVCYDADECAFGTHNCDVDAVCTNLDGTFSCSCQTGFVGDGLECFKLCSETESDACHKMAYCQDATCTCPEGIYGGGYGVAGCTREAWSVRFSIRLPWVTSADLTASNKLEDWDTYQPDYILLLTTSPPTGFNTSMHHEVQLLDSAQPGGLLTISSLFGSEFDANTARLRLQGFLDAATPPTVFGVTLTASQTTIEGAAARRNLDNTTGLIVGSYPVEPRVYTWVAETTSAEIRVLPTGLNVDSLYFEPACKQTGCWVAEITYTTGEDNFNVIYIPNAQAANDSASFDFDYDVQMNHEYAMTALETFTISNFPCGSNNYVPDSDPSSDIPTKVTACCIPEFVQLYRPVASFISEVASKVTQTTCDMGKMTYFLPASFIETEDTISYRCKPSDAVWGGFAGMDYAEVVFTGVLDPFVRQYSATVYFDEAELRQKAGILRGTVGVEHTVDTFIGIANFKPTGIAFLDSFAMQVNLHLEKTSFFSVSTHGVNDYTFLEYVNMRLVSIYAEDVDFSSLAEAGNRTLRTNSSGNANYIQVTFTMGDQYQPNPLSGGLIPLDSVRAGRGTFFSSTILEHLCVSYDQADPLQHDIIGLTSSGKAGDVAVFNAMLVQPCAPASSMCVNPESVPDQFVSFNIPLGFEAFDGQESNSLDNNIFVSMVINALDKGATAGPNPNQGNAPLQMKTTLDASIPIVAGGINIFCDGITAKTDLKDVANADIIVGSAANATELMRLRIIKDIASTNLDSVPSTQIDSDSIEEGLVTLVLKGKSSYFENGVVNTQGYSLELDDLVTIHLMTDGEAPSQTDAECSSAITAGTESADCAVRALLLEAPDDNTDSNGLDTDGYKLNGAFKFEVDRGLGIAKLQPTSDLLAICPFNPTRPSGGLILESCITRRDVRSRTYPVRQGAAGPTAMEILAQTDNLVSDSLANEMAALEGQRTTTCTCSEGDDKGHDPAEDECCEAGFMQMILGENDYARDLAVDYVKTIHQRYTLNGRYMRAYWINPGYEWTPTQTAGKSIFSVSQKVYLFALITLDENISRRRMLLATDVRPTEDSGSGVGGAQLAFPVSRTSIMAQAFDVPADKAVVFRVEMQLTQAEACMSDTEFAAQARGTFEVYLDTAASSFHSVQVLGFSRDLNGVACRRALRKLLADLSEATASVQMLIVYKDEGEAVFNDAAFAGMAGITSVAVDHSSAGNVDVDPTYTNSVPNSKPGSKEDGGSSSNTAMIAGIAGGVGGAVLVVGGVFLFMRGRGHETQVAEPVPTINVNDLKAQLNEDV